MNRDWAMVIALLAARMARCRICALEVPVNYSYIALAAIAVLQILDIMTTVNIIRWDNGVELNKVTAWFIHKFGLVGGLIIIKSLATAPIAVAVYLGIAPLWSLLLVAAIMFAVVAHNAIEMKG